MTSVQADDDKLRRRTKERNTVVIPILDSRSPKLVKIDRGDVNDRLVKFMSNHDVPLECYLDCCMVALERGDLELSERFAEAGADVALSSSRSERSFRALNERSNDRSRESAVDRNYLRVKLICFLGDIYLERARQVDATQDTSGNPSNEKRRLTDLASKYYYKATLVDGKQMLPHLGMGNVAVLKGNVQVARQEYGAAIQSRNGRQRSVAGVISLAKLEYGEKNYGDALGLYKKALRQCPEVPAEVRAAIGACHFCLGNLAKARQAFERALQLNPGCVVASIGMGVIERGNDGKDGKDVETPGKKGGAYPKSLVKARKQDASHPYMALSMAEYAMSESMYEEALEFANVAKAAIPSDDVAARAQLTSTIGRLHHATGNLEKAAACYREAIDMDKQGCRSARLALAQVLTSRRDLTQATSMFQQLMREYPAWLDIASYFGPLIPHFKGGQKSAEMVKEFARMVEETDDDPRLWEVLGDIVCLEDPARALKAYKRAIELFCAAPSHDADGDVEMATENATKMDYAKAPCRLMNNAAVLYLRTGQTATAFNLLSAAMESVKSGKLGNMHPLSQVTLGYNIARTTEAMGDVQSAEKEYVALLKEFPKYVDCQLRLACICKKRGDIRGAEKWAREAAEASSNSADALGLLAGIHIDRRDLGSAKKCVDELLAALPTESKGVEVYGRLALGNIHLYSIPGDLHQDGNYEKAVSNLTHAMGLYRRALEKDPGNLFAANGIGCVLAESGRLKEAKDVFMRVQEAAAATDGFVTVSDASVNLAGVQLGLQQPKAAVATFLQACKKNPSLQLDPRLLLYLSKAQYESDQVGPALKTIAKALHIAPGDHRLRFNAAYLMQQAGAKILKQDSFVGGDDGKVAAYKGAASSFDNSHRIFESLLSLGQATTGIAAKKLEHHVAFAAEMHKSALDRVKKAEERALQADAKRQEVAIRKAAADKLKELEAMKVAAKAEAERRLAQEIALEAEVQHRDVLASVANEKKRLKAIAKGDVTNLPDKKSKEMKDAQKEIAMDQMFADESEDDEYVPGDEQQDEAPPEAGADVGEEEEEAEYVDSDDDEDEDEDEEDGGDVGKKKGKGKKDSKGNKKAKGKGKKKAKAKSPAVKKTPAKRRADAPAAQLEDPVVDDPVVDGAPTDSAKKRAKTTIDSDDE